MRRFVCSIVVLTMLSLSPARAADPASAVGVGTASVRVRGAADYVIDCGAGSMRTLFVSGALGSDSFALGGAWRGAGLSLTVDGNATVLQQDPGFLDPHALVITGRLRGTGIARFAWGVWAPYGGCSIAVNGKALRQVRTGKSVFLDQTTFPGGLGATAVAASASVARSYERSVNGYVYAMLIGGVGSTYVGPAGAQPLIGEQGESTVVGRRAKGRWLFETTAGVALDGAPMLWFLEFRS